MLTKVTPYSHKPPDC